MPISPIPTVPAGVYSAKYTSVDEIPDGAKVAVPNDASNTARCYLMLQKIGWIKLADDVDPSAVTQDDIVENPHNIEFTEMKSLTIPAAIQDFDYVAITGSVVYNAGIDRPQPSQQRISRITWYFSRCEGREQGRRVGKGNCGRLSF